MAENEKEYRPFLVDQVPYMTLTTKKYENRKKWQPSNPKEICSIIPGSVIDVFVKPGQKVKSGEVLLILDSMKMHTKIEMPYDGVIKAVNLAKGDRIPKNAVMITIK
ncbi:MAG: biotin/lipoyl-binding protein [Bacteroidia bacterium]|nr:biotin/lipoyl-binding protein [Bacteroidia bacterium]